MAFGLPGEPAARPAGYGASCAATQPRRQRRARKFDWPGLFLFAGSVVPLCGAGTATERRTCDADRDRDVPGLPRAAVAAGAASGAPAVPAGPLRRPAMWRANAMAACSGSLLVSEATILPIHLRAVDGASAGKIGLDDAASDCDGWGRIADHGATGLAYWACRHLPRGGSDRGGVGLAARGVRDGPGRGGCSPLGTAGDAGGGGGVSGLGHAVAQITMQSQARPAMLGAASASVQLSRSVGSAIGVTVAMGVLFVILGRNAAIVMSSPTPFDTVLPHWRACQKRRALRR